VGWSENESGSDENTSSDGKRNVGQFGNGSWILQEENVTAKQCDGKLSKLVRGIINVTDPNDHDDKHDGNESENRSLKPEFTVLEVQAQLEHITHDLGMM